MPAGGEARDQVGAQTMPVPTTRSCRLAWLS